MPTPTITSTAELNETITADNDLQIPIYSPSSASFSSFNFSNPSSQATAFNFNEEILASPNLHAVLQDSPVTHRQSSSSSAMVAGDKMSVETPHVMMGLSHIPMISLLNNNQDRSIALTNISYDSDSEGQQKKY